MATPEDQLNEAARKATAASDIAYQWINGPEYTYVTTDSGLVPTIAEVSRTQKNLLPDLQAESSKAEAAALSAASSANNAATSATIAKNEADRATQITGISTVTSAIAQSTHPLPDVWLPLNDSLGIVLGYGREVKVGSDVVARFAGVDRLSKAGYFDKNGVLQIAANNEPRFEAKGLLIEGVSSNCVQYADKPAQWTAMDLWFATFSTLAQDGQSKAPTGVYTVTALSNTMRITNSAANQKQLAIGEFLTASARFKLSDQNVNFRFRFANQNGFQGAGLVGADGTNQGSDSNVTISITKLPDGYISASATMTCKDVGLHYGEFYIIAKGSSNIPIGTELRMQLPQVEQLPSRSSFIPSDAAEAVREADKPWIQRVGNDNYFGPVTISADISCNGPGVAGNMPDARRGIFSGYPSNGAYEMILIDPANSKVAWAYGTAQFSGGTNQPIVTDGLTHTIVAQMDGITNRVYTDGVKGSSEQVATPVFGTDNGTGKDKLLIGYGAGGTQARHLWGHIRNIRIWHKALSNEQCQTIR